MDEWQTDEQNAPQAVRATDMIEHIAEYILGQEIPVRVVDDQDQTVGVLHRQKVLKILFPQSSEPTA